jgi:hypothetical protein
MLRPDANTCTRDDLRQSHRRGEALGGRPGFDNKKQAALAAAL